MNKFVKEMVLPFLKPNFEVKSTTVNPKEKNMAHKTKALQHVYM